MKLRWETPTHHLASTASIADVMDANNKTQRIAVFRMMGRQCSVKLNGKYLGKHKDMLTAKTWAEENIHTLIELPA